MTQTRQMTLEVDGKKIVISARRLSTGVGGIKYAVSVNDWKSSVLVKLHELEDTGRGLADAALDHSMGEALAKWLKGAKQ